LAHPVDTSGCDCGSSRRNAFHIKVYLDDAAAPTAHGDLFWDDGDSIGYYVSRT